MIRMSLHPPPNLGLQQNKYYQFRSYTITIFVLFSCPILTFTSKPLDSALPASIQDNSLSVGLKDCSRRERARDYTVRLMCRSKPTLLCNIISSSQHMAHTNTFSHSEQLSHFFCFRVMSHRLPGGGRPLPESHSLWRPWGGCPRYQATEYCVAEAEHNGQSGRGSGPRHGERSSSGGPLLWMWTDSPRLGEPPL